MSGLGRRRFFDPKYCRERRRTYILACLVFWSILSYLGITHYVLQATQVVGTSMEPTLYDGDRLVINRLIYRLRDPRPGEVVAVVFPDEDAPAVKRIVAVPRDRVQIADDRVVVNGKPLDEPYVPAGNATTRGALSTAAYEVAANSYFVLGDNREASMDSRYLGAVTRDRIIGRIKAR